MQKILDIALPISLDINFSYYLPKDFSKENLIGKRALVPFRNKTASGVIINVRESVKEENLKYIYELIDAQPVISQNNIDFAKWLQEYYITSLGETLKMFLPPGISPKSVQKVKIKDGIPNILIYRLLKKAPVQGKILKVLSESKDYISVANIKQQLDKDSIATQISSLAASGYIEVMEEISSSTKSKYQKALRLIETNETNLVKYIQDIDKKAPKQAILLSFMLHNYKQGKEDFLMSEISDKYQISQSVANSLEKKGIIEIYNKQIDRTINDYEKLSHKNELKFKLSPKQEEIKNQVITNIMKNDLKPVLLYGITGSGKTLVYLHLVEYTIKNNKNALFIVPEISLTPQLTDRFSNSFPGKTVVLHSKMSQGERHDAWYKILHNQVNIIIGARSALFAPINDLGLIIVDEEHDRSYKQDAPNPKYNARDAAIVKAKMENIPIVLGSATPSFESYYNSISGLYHLLEINERADGAKMPDITLIDMKDNQQTGQKINNFSRKLIDKIIDRINKKEGVILLQNRRGFSASLFCEYCGYIAMCKNCDISLTYHKKHDVMKCHYCGYTEKAHKVCPECGNPEIRKVGFGTQRIEEDLEEILISNGVEASIERLDLDTTSKKGAHRQILSDFANGKTDILIGTQMVAKGIDFERVTLIGVLSADMSLFIPDFRSYERTFSLITQVAGRAGRSSDKNGEVIIQSYNPNNIAVKYALNSDYKTFYESEIQNRMNANYPPVSRFIYIEFRGKNENLCMTHAKMFNKYLPADNSFLEVLGPSIPAIARLKNNFRRVIVIKNIKQYDKKGKKVRSILKNAIDNYKKNYKTNNIRLSINIDSQSSV
jgi:primosomal protein N' (replication factor Y)